MGDLINAALSGDKRATLIALRDRLAEELENASARDFAPLSRQFMEVLRALDESPDEKEVSPADDIAARREARRKQRQSDTKTQPDS
ncbi:hypothetical protein ABZ714_14325 [Streptomyces sp. NPDC006798]|uniref:hypothetical protein n=1 Tax=Streptomyces sp. NPDC006798 TaxID=3155462 RepID=UPI0033F40750